MTYLALDLSKSCTGWAFWDGRSDVPHYGHWVLGSEYTSDGQVYVKLHRCLADLFAVMRFERLYFEEPINPAHLSGSTSIHTIEILSGLAAHTKSFGHAKRCRIVKPVNVERWRKDFIGDMVVREIKAGVRRQRKAGDEKASARDKLKRLTIERCRQLGLTPRKNDEADAIGILTYSVLLEGVTPPWIAAEVLRPNYEAAA